MKAVFRIALAIVFFVPVSLTAQSMVGTWIMTGEMPDGQKMEVKLEYSEDGTYTVDVGNDGNVNVEGASSIEGDQMTIWDTGGEYACPSDVKGVYTFEFLDDNTLQMKKVKDACEGRGGPEGMMVFKRT